MPATDGMTRGGKMTATVNPEIETWMRLTSDIPQDVPVTLVNFLKFRETADYPPETGYPPCSGRDAYQRYNDLVLQILPAVNGQRIWTAEVLGKVIGPEQEFWDEFQMVQYPSIGAFLEMLVLPEFQAAASHRAAALEDSRVVITRTPAEAESGQG